MSFVFEPDDEDIPLNNEQPETAIETTNGKFDYSILDEETKNYLQSKETRIKDIVFKSATELGKELKESQILLGKKGYGCFMKWCETLGFTSKTANNLIDRYEFVLENFSNSNLLESLPLSLSYEISKPSAPKVLVEATLNGDITSHKDYKYLESQLKAKDSEIEQIKLTAKTLGRTLDEKVEQLRSKQTMISTLLSRPAEVKEIQVESPELTSKLAQLQEELDHQRSLNENKNNEIKKMTAELDQLVKVKAKQAEIEKVHSQIEKLKKEQNDMWKKMEGTQEVFKFISRTKDFIKAEMLHIPGLTHVRDQYSDVMIDELKMIIKQLNDFTMAIEYKFNIK